MKVVMYTCSSMYIDFIESLKSLYGAFESQVCCGYSTGMILLCIRALISVLNVSSGMENIVKIYRKKLLKWDFFTVYTISTTRHGYCRSRTWTFGQSSTHIYSRKFDIQIKKFIVFYQPGSNSITQPPLGLSFEFNLPK